MSEPSYMVLIPEKVNIRYSSYEEAFEAVKEYLQEHRDKFILVPIYEMSDNPERTTRYVFLAGERFHTINVSTETE